VKTLRSELSHGINHGVNDKLNELVKPPCIVTKD
jgi:hypothetical protein